MTVQCHTEIETKKKKWEFSVGQPVLHAVLASGSDSIHTRLQAKQEMTQLHRPRQCVLFQYRPLSSECRGARPSVNAAHYVHVSNMFVFFLFTFLNLTEFIGHYAVLCHTVST